MTRYLARWHCLAPHTRILLVVTAVAVVYALVVAAVAASVGRLHWLQTILYARTTFLLLGVAAFVVSVVYLLWVVSWVRPDRPVVWAYRHLRDRVHLHRRLARGLPLLWVLTVFFGLFTVFKAMIPLLVPYAWDSAFHELDRSLFGDDPWRYFARLYAYPQAIQGVNVLYNLWFLIQFLFIYGSVFALKNEALRLQFILTFMLGWIVIGSGLALLLSSVGPCYFQYLVAGEDPYAELMSVLHGVEQHATLWALDTQRTLWEAYQTDTLALGSGISAMPSMHVAVATLFMLVAWRIRRWLGVVFGVYALVILGGSVILAWHYAVDGLLAILVILMLWRVSGGAARRILRVQGQVILD